MSSGVYPTFPKTFFCHQCNRTVSISISSSADPFCPRCSGGFLEECDQPPNPNPSPIGFDPFSTLLPLLLGSAAFDPVHLQSSGTNVQFVIEDHHHPPGNMGDYFLGPGLEQLIQQLAENDPSRYGTPPASRSAVDALPSVKVTVGMLRSEMNQCAVCMDEFEEGGDVKEMPCKHVFHQGCLMPWLELHNSCPVCRYELPTDDPDYETRGGGGQGSVEGQRRFSVQLPWGFRSQDGSGSGARGGGGGGSNLETRQEDLD